MSFLNAALLAALSLGLIPILIHLLNRQRFKKIEFPTLRFLKEMQRQKMRQVKVRQILLLLLRTLAVIFLVLALTRPVLHSTAGILPGAGAKTSAVLILDRSASMQTETTSGDRFRELQTRAQEVLALLGDGDEVQVVWADNEPKRFPEAPTTNIKLVREAIGEATATSAGGNLVEALRAARTIIGQTQNLHKEVYLISDFSGSGWPERMPETELLPEDVRLFLLPTSQDARHNLGVVNARITSRLITPGRPVEIAIDVVNTGESAAEDRIVSVYLAGRRVAQTRASVQPGKTQEYRLKFVPEEPGSQAGYVRIEDPDDFAPDDRREFVLRVPPRLQVAVVGSEGPARSLTALALNPARDPDAFVQVNEYTSAQFETADWGDVDAIVVVDAGEFGIGFENRVREFVESGKGVLILPGPQFNMRAHAGWMGALGMPGMLDIVDAGDTPFTWGQIDLAHPLFEGLFEQEPSVISPDFQKIVSVNTSGTAVSIISLTNELPFMLESRAGRGRSILLLSSPDPDWSSMFRAGIFPPLMVGGVTYLSGIGTSGEEYQCDVGVPSQLTFTGRPANEVFEVRRDEWSAALGVEAGATGYALRMPALSASGEYSLWQGNRRLGVVVANVPASESQIAAVPEAAYEDILGGQVTELGASTKVEDAIVEGRFGRELWKLCLYLALALLLAEMLLGRVGRREATVAAQ